MDIGINNQTIAYIDLSSKMKKAADKESTEFKDAVEKTKKSVPVYAVSGSTNGKVPSVVDDFKTKHPEQAGAVGRMVSSGIKARQMYGISEVNTDEMSMEEYKDYISGILDKIPFDSSRPYDEEVMYISDEGWEQMKKDSDYEAWVLGYTVENRAVRNPFFGLGDMGGFCIEHFGASIEEHHGEGYSKVYGGTARGARSMFESAASGKGAIRKNAPRAGEQSPADWSLEEEQRKARRRKKNFWDEIFETQLQHRTQLREKLNREYFEGKRMEHYQMLSDFNNGSFRMGNMMQV